MSPVASTSNSAKKPKKMQRPKKRVSKVRVSKDYSTSEKKEKYSGLTPQEKGFVHALRALFDPKGKRAASRGGSSEKICDSPKGERKSDSSEKEKKKSNPKVIPVTVKAKGKTMSTIVRPPREAGKHVRDRLVKKAEESLRKRCAEKRVSPSKMARAERRAGLGEKFVKMQRERTLPASLDRSKVVGAFESRKGLLQGAPRKGKKWMPLTAITPLLTCELEVEKAFGGSAALQMLRGIRNLPKGSKYSHKSYTGIPTLSSASTTRDYNIAVKDLRINVDHSEKRVPSRTAQASKVTKGEKADIAGGPKATRGLTSEVRASKVKQTVPTPSKGKTIPGNRKPKKVTRSQLLRKEKRALRAAEKSAVKPTSPLSLPEMARSIIPQGLTAPPPAKEMDLFDTVDDVLSKIQEGISRGEYQSRRGSDVQKIYENVEALMGHLLSMKVDGG